MFSKGKRIHLKDAIHNKTLVNGFLFSLFSFFGQGMSFVLLILLANYILPAEYGKLSLFTTLISLLGFLIAFSSRGYCSITYFKKDQEGFKKDFTAIVALGLISVLILSIPVFLVGDWLGGKLEMTKDLLWYAVLIAFFSFTFQLQQDYLRNKEKVISYGVFNCGNALFNFVISLILVINLKQSWMGRVNAQLYCTLFYGLFAIVFFVKKDLFRFGFTKSIVTEILAWSIPMIPHAASAWLRQGLDRYVINFFYSTYEVGIFSFAINITNVIIMIGTAFNSANSVTQYQILSDKNFTNEEKKLKLSRQHRIIAFVYIGVTAVVLLLSTPLVYFFLPKYVESIPYMWILAVSGLGNCIYFIYCNYLFYFDKTKLLMYITFGTAVLHLALSLCFTRFSLYCTGVIYVAVMALMTYLVWRLAKKTIEENLQYR